MKITLITLEGCPHCEAVKKTLAKIKPDYPNVTIVEHEVNTPEGKKWVEKYQLKSAPTIFIDDQLFATGEVSEEKFRKKLDESK